MKNVFWLFVILSVALMLTGCASRERVEELEYQVGRLVTSVQKQQIVVGGLSRYLKGETVFVSRVKDAEKDECSTMKWQLGKKPNWKKIKCSKLKPQEN